MRNILPFMVVGILVLSGLGAVATNIENEKKMINNEKIGEPLDYTHTVLVEAGMRTGCPACPATNAAWKSIYAGGNYDFEYCGLIYQQNPDAMQRFNSFNPAYVPTSYWDGGQYVYVGTNTNTFKNYLDAAGSRSVPDLIGEVSAMWQGDAKIDISISVENDDNDDYTGTLRVYVVEIVSRWNDYNGQPYGHALLDFAWQQSIDIDSGDTFEDDKLWDGASVGYSDIEPDNIQVILTVSDDEPHQSYSDPPSGNPFNAYYVDETIATLVEQNTPPEKPTVNGPTDIEPNVEYQYSFVSDDPNDDDVMYYIDWGDNFQGWLGPYSSGETIYINHTWTESGIFEITAKARDELYQEGEWSDPITVIVGNLAPEAPVITGEISGTSGTEYEYTFVATDSNDDDLYYYIKWGDGTIVEWDGPHASGNELKLSHKWDSQGNFMIEAKAKDPDGAESGWGRLTINMPRSRAKYSPIFNFLQSHPNLFPIIRYMLRI